MSYQYTSDEWITETGKLLKEAFSTPSRVSTTLIEVYKNCPDGKTKWIQMELEKGIMTVHRSGEGPSPEAKYKILGDYEEYIKVADGSTDPEAALMQGNFDFQGNLVSGLTLIGIYKKMLRIRRTLDTVY